MVEHDDPSLLEEHEDYEEDPENSVFPLSCPYTKKELNGMTKAELLSVMSEMNFSTAHKRGTRNDLIKRIVDYYKEIPV